MRHIVILLHKYFTFDTLQYFLRYIADIWQENGFRVSVLHGPGPYVQADLAILHINLTVVPDDYLAFIRQYPLTINGRLTDISKRQISTSLLRRGDNYHGQVIVKTNYNCRGGSEYSLVKKGPLLTKCAQSLRNRLPWSWRAKLPEYRIFDSISNVPHAVWHNPDLVVERFLPERHDSFYCLRTWFFLGDKETNSISYSNQPIIKAGNVIRRENLDEVPEELRQIRRNMGFDYGKFDYALIDGKTVLYDVNWTPTFGGLPGEQALSSIRLLADGIRSYL
jgi:hypothetical protein